MANRKRQTRSDTQCARELRVTSTQPETILWNALRNRRLAGLKFRRQVPIGAFYVDFFCSDSNLIIELDGESHEGRQKYDMRRSLYLESCGYRVFRITNDDVVEDIEAVALGIAKAAGVDLDAWLKGRISRDEKQSNNPDH